MQLPLSNTVPSKHKVHINEDPDLLQAPQLIPFTTLHLLQVLVSKASFDLQLKHVLFPVPLQVTHCGSQGKAVLFDPSS